MGKKEVIEVMVEGGNAKPTPPLGPKLSQLRLPVGKVVQEINQKTKDFKGLLVPVKIIVDVETKEYTIEVGTPPTSQLLFKEAGINLGAHRAVHEWVGNVSMEAIVKIAKMKLKDMNTVSLKAAVKSVLGTARACGIKVENRDPKEILKEVEEDKWDDLIKKYESS